MALPTLLKCLNLVHEPRWEHDPLIEWDSLPCLRPIFYKAPMMKSRDMVDYAEELFDPDGRGSLVFAVPGGIYPCHLYFLRQ